MKKVIRSLVWKDQAERDPCSKNYQHLAQDRLLNLSSSEDRALIFLTDFYQRTGEAAQLQLLYDHFEDANNAEGITLFEEVNIETAYFGGSFVDLFEAEVESQAQADLNQKLRLANKIATTGAEVRKGVTVKGVDEAVAYIFNEVRPAPKANSNVIPTNMRKASAALDQLYLSRKNNPHDSYGVMTGYGIFDAAWHGLKKKQFTLLGGFGGHLKSTLMMNIVLNGAVDGGWNQYICSSEMPADDLMLMMITIHSGNPIFSGVGRPLPATRLILGALNQQEEDFLKIVKDDLLTNPKYGSIRIRDSGDFSSFGSICQMVTRDDAEEEVDSLWIDYITRLPLDAKYRGMDHTTAVNLTLADAKRFSMQFKKGTGLPVSSPFQINREGYKKAMANGGRMDKTSFAQYNAAEKEADNMAYIFYDKDEEATSEPKAGLAKARWGKMVHDPINFYIEPDCRRIYDLTAGMNTQTGYSPSGSGVGDVVDL